MVLCGLLYFVVYIHTKSSVRLSLLSKRVHLVSASDALALLYGDSFI